MSGSIKKIFRSLLKEASGQTGDDQGDPGAAMDALSELEPLIKRHEEGKDISVQLTRWFKSHVGVIKIALGIPAFAEDPQQYTDLGIPIPGSKIR